MSMEERFLENLDLVERVCASICRRYACRGDEADEFDATVKQKLLEDDYAVFRKFQGRSSLSTYLTTVIHNLFRDFRIRRWGKWRPSVAAKRLGDEAIRLETLLYRDRYTLDEAINILRINYQSQSTPQELSELAAQLPARTQRHHVGEEYIAGLESGDRVDDELAAREKQATASEAERMLAGALAQLDVEDRLLLKMRFEDGFSVADIARALGERPRLLYSRFERCLLELRDSLASEGIEAHKVKELLGWKQLDFEVDYQVENEGDSPITSV